MDWRRKLWQITQMNNMVTTWQPRKKKRSSSHCSNYCKWFEINIRLFLDTFAIFCLDLIAEHCDHMLHIMAKCATKTCRFQLTAVILSVWLLTVFTCIRLFIMSNIQTLRITFYFFRCLIRALLTILMKMYCIFPPQEIIVSGCLGRVSYNSNIVPLSDSLTTVLNQCTGLNCSLFTELMLHTCALVILIQSWQSFVFLW